MVPGNNSEAALAKAEAAKSRRQDGNKVCMLGYVGPSSPLRGVWT